MMPTHADHPQCHEHIRTACRGNDDAYRFIVELYSALKFFDAVVDGEGVTSDQARSAMWDLLLSIPANSFYRANESVLRPMIANAILSWEDSNILVHCGDEGVEIAHSARYAVNDIAVMVAYLVGGKQWANEIGPQLRIVLRDERLEDFQKEIRDGMVS